MAEPFLSITTRSNGVPVLIISSLDAGRSVTVEAKTQARPAIPPDVSLGVRTYIPILTMTGNGTNAVIPFDKAPGNPISGAASINFASSDQPYTYYNTIYRRMVTEMFTFYIPNSFTSTNGTLTLIDPLMGMYPIMKPHGQPLTDSERSPIISGLKNGTISSTNIFPDSLFFRLKDQ